MDKELRKLLENAGIKEDEFGRDQGDDAEWPHERGPYDTSDRKDDIAKGPEFSSLYNMSNKSDWGVELIEDLKSLISGEEGDYIDAYDILEIIEKYGDEKAKQWTKNYRDY